LLQFCCELHCEFHWCRTPIMKAVRTVFTSQSPLWIVATGQGVFSHIMAPTHIAPEKPRFWHRFLHDRIWLRKISLTRPSLVNRTEQEEIDRLAAECFQRECRFSIHPTIGPWSSIASKPPSKS